MQTRGFRCRSPRRERIRPRRTRRNRETVRQCGGSIAPSNARIHRRSKPQTSMTQSWLFFSAYLHSLPRGYHPGCPREQPRSWNSNVHADRGTFLCHIPTATISRICRGGDYWASLVDAARTPLLPFMHSDGVDSLSHCPFGSPHSEHDYVACACRIQISETCP